MFAPSRRRTMLCLAAAASLTLGCDELFRDGDDAGVGGEGGAAGEGGGGAGGGGAGGGGAGGGGAGGGGVENPASAELADAVNQYRVEQGLASIPVSNALTRVAEAHVRDLETNDPTGGQCNLHSWSAAGEWSACCYTEDHAQAQCMWDKPGELTSYPGYGYEIAYVDSGGATPDGALNGWIGSSGHHDVILSRGPWADRPWHAMGAAIQGQYAVVWFGEEAD